MNRREIDPDAVLASLATRRSWRDVLRHQLEEVAAAPAEERADWLRLAAFRLGRMPVSHEAQWRRLLLAAARRHGIPAEAAEREVTAGLADGRDYRERGLP